METKKCFKCDITKPLSEFYRHPQMGDGRLGKCKECAKADVQENRLIHLDYYKEYDRGRANIPSRVLGRMKYSKSEAGKKSVKLSKKKWLANNTVKRAAHILVGNSVRDGKIMKPKKCSVCGLTRRIHGHHDDYAKPLDVRWLCSACHTKWHKENGEGKF